jgi:hypothetical protein
MLAGVMGNNLTPDFEGADVKNTVSTQALVVESFTRAASSFVLRIKKAVIESE